MTDTFDLVTPFLQTLQPAFTVGDAPDGTAVLSTPFRFLSGDPLEVAAWREEGEVVLSDRGGLVKALMLSGVDVLDSPSHWQQVEAALAKHGAEFDGGVVVRPVGGLTLGEAVQVLIQSLMDGQAAGEAAWRGFQGQPETETHAVVRALLDGADARYRESMRVSGALGRRYPVDFQFAVKARELVRGVLVIARDRTLEFAERWNFRFRDIREARPRLRTVVAVDATAQWSEHKQRILEPVCDAVLAPGDAQGLAAFLRTAAGTP